MFEYDEDIDSDIVTCIKNQTSGENGSFKCKFYPKVCLSKVGLSMHMRVKYSSHSDSGVLRLKLELPDFSLMHQKSAQKV